jgi:hypothetical protein
MHDSGYKRPRGVHYTELAKAKQGDTFFHEWNGYRREVGRLLAEGQEGRHVLIKACFRQSWLSFGPRPAFFLGFLAGHK